MSSLFTMIAERAADAGATVEDLRAGINKLTEQLTAAETELSRLAITRDDCHVAGLHRTDERDTTVAQPAYLNILAEFERADGPLRAGRLQPAQRGTRQRLRQRREEGPVHWSKPDARWTGLPLQDHKLGRSAKISASLSRSPIGSNRSAANALVTAR